MSLTTFSLRIPLKQHALIKESRRRVSALNLGSSQLLLTLDLQEENEAATALGQLRVDITWPALCIPESLHPPQGESPLCSGPGFFRLKLGHWPNLPGARLPESCGLRFPGVPGRPNILVLPHLVVLVHENMWSATEVTTSPDSYLGKEGPPL